MLKPEDLVGTWEMVEYYLEKDGVRNDAICRDY